MNNNEEIQPKLNDKQIAVHLLQQQGLKNGEIAQTLGLSDGRVSQIKSSLKKYDLTNADMVRGAHRTIKKLMNGKPFGTIDKVKDSTALQAASLVMDRAQPAVKVSQNMNMNVSFTDVNLDKYKATGIRQGIDEDAKE